MEQDDRLLNAMFEMCNHKILKYATRVAYIADISGLLREERYDEPDERWATNPCADGELLPAAKRKALFLRSGIVPGQPFLR